MQKGDSCFEMAFGMPWTPEEFIIRATENGHPANFCKRVPQDIQHAVDFHVEPTADEICSYRLEWCKRWLKRSLELAKEEKELAKNRSAASANKKILLI